MHLMQTCRDLKWDSINCLYICSFFFHRKNFDSEKFSSSFTFSLESFRRHSSSIIFFSSRILVPSVSTSNCKRISSWVLLVNSSSCFNDWMWFSHSSFSFLNLFKFCSSHFFASSSFAFSICDSHIKVNSNVS